MSYDLLIYDDKCYFCSLSAGLMKKFDFLHLIKLQPSSDPGTLSFNLSADQIDLAVQVIRLREGKRLSGFKAVTYCALRSPPLFPIYIFLLILRMTGKSNRVYEKVAMNRYIISSMIQNRI